MPFITVIRFGLVQRRIRCARRAPNTKQKSAAIHMILIGKRDSLFFFSFNFSPSHTRPTILLVFSTSIHTFLRKVEEQSDKCNN